MQGGHQARAPPGHWRAPGQRWWPRADAVLGTGTWVRPQRGCLGNPYGEPAREPAAQAHPGAGTKADSVGLCSYVRVLSGGGQLGSSLQLTLM